MTKVKRPKMRFSVKAYGERYTGSIRDDANIYEVVPVLKGLLAAIGFHSDVVDEIFVERGCSDCKPTAPIQSATKVTEQSNQRIELIYDLN